MCISSLMRVNAASGPRGLRKRSIARARRGFVAVRRTSRGDACSMHAWRRRCLWPAAVTSAGAEVLGIPVAVAGHLSFSASRLVRALTGAPPSRPANRFCATEQAPASPSLPCSVRSLCLLGIQSGRRGARCNLRGCDGQKCSPRPSNLSALLRPLCVCSRD